MRSLPFWGASLLLAAPHGAWALGLGDIELQSALNQPFQAEIRLLSATPEELEGLQVGLASRETFDRYGLDRPAELSTLVFEVVRNRSGQDVIRVTSRDSMADPFLTMLVEVTWPRGRRLREYTVLLDPPLFNPEIGAEPPIRQAEVSSPQPGIAGGAIARTATPAAAGTASALAAAAAVSAAPRNTTPQSGGTYGPVQRAETLWNIASELRPDDVSVNQMMVALYESNPRAFDGNMNILRSGTTLTVPERDRLLAMNAAAATAEVRRHETSWQSGGQAQREPAEPQQARLRLVPTVTEEAGAAGAGVGGSGAASGSGNSAGSSDADVQRLQGEVAALRDELENSRRLLELRNEQLQELQARLSEEPQAAQAGANGEGDAAAAVAATPAAAPGVDLESEQLFTDESELPVAATEPEAQSVEAPPAAVAVPAAATVATAAETLPEPSLLSRVLGWISNPLLLIGFGVGAMLLTAVWYLRHRREEDEDVTGRWEALEAEVEEEEYAHEDTARLRPVQNDSLIVDEQPRSRAALDDSTASFASAVSSAASDLDVIDDTLSSQSVINLDQADFLAEADFHMAYGLYDQAADLVSKAVEKEPARRDLKLKLLEVYFVWGNKDAFLSAARALRTGLGEESDGDWDKVLIMGKQICPDEPMFAESAAGGAVDLDLHGDGSTELDFAFDEKESEALDLDFGSSSRSSVDLELSATGERMGTADDDDIEYELDDSLDIGAQTAAGLEAALFQDDDQDDEQDAQAEGDDRAYGGSFDTDTDVELDGLAETQESPTVENPRSGLDDDWAAAFSVDSETIEEPLGHNAPTVETPTVETMGPDAPTVETLGPDAATVETPTIETAYNGTARMKAPDAASGMFSLEQPGSGAGEHTEEIDLDDLGLSIDDFADLPDDIGELPHADDGDSDTREQPALVADDDLLSATGVTEVLTDEDELEHLSTALLTDQEATLLAPGYGYGDDTLGGTEVLGGPDQEIDIAGDTSLLAALDDGDFGAAGYDGNGLDLDLEDLAAALHGGDTVEQPGNNSFERDVFGGDASTPIDLDIGSDFAESDDPTGTEGVIGMDPQTMTEIGTKLDLARAYIDMGDPEGARSILEEVLDEGDTGQKREAQGLIDVLTA